MKYTLPHLFSRKESKPVLFLDIDGVLNSTSFYNNENAKGIIDTTRLPILKRIVDATGCILVLTSSWRDGFSMNMKPNTSSAREITEVFAAYGLKLSSRTEKSADFGQRGLEINHWLEAHHHPKHWAVVDDYMFEDFEEQGILSHLIRTDYAREGLSLENEEELIYILSL